jgi:glyoxylate utilization-related uncharacterized protein
MITIIKYRIDNIRDLLGHKADLLKRRNILSTAFAAMLQKLKHERNNIKVYRKCRANSLLE